MSVNAAHAYMPGSHTPGIEWFYIEGNIKYDDDWSHPVGYNQQQR